MLKIVVFLLAFLSLNVFASPVQSPFSKLPFGITPGLTKNSEIEQRGVCFKRIRVSDSVFRCEGYNMLNGKFTVYSSQNEVVTEVLFSLADGNTLPQNWTSLGLKLGLKPNDYGTSARNAYSIIERAGVENLTSTEIDDTTKVIEFDVNGLKYQFVFSNSYLDNSAGIDDGTLFKIWVSELY